MSDIPSALPIRGYSAIITMSKRKVEDIAKAISLAMSKNAQLKDVLAMIQFLAKYTGQEPASKSMLVDDEEKGINPFKEFYEAICGEKDYTR